MTKEGRPPLGEVVAIGPEKRMRELEAKGFKREIVARGEKEAMEKSREYVRANSPSGTEFFIQSNPDGSCELVTLVPPVDPWAEAENTEEKLFLLFKDQKGDEPLITDRPREDLLGLGFQKFSRTRLTLEGAKNHVRTVGAAFPKADVLIRRSVSDKGVESYEVWIRH